MPRISPSKRYLPTLDLTRAAAHPSSSHASLIEVEANEHFPSSSFATVWKGRSGNGRDPIYIKVVGQPDLHLAVQEARVYDSLRTRGRAGLSVGFKGAYVMPDSSFAVLVLKDGGSALGAWQELPEPIKWATPRPPSIPDHKLTGIERLADPNFTTPSANFTTVDGSTAISDRATLSSATARLA